MSVRLWTGYSNKFSSPSTCNLSDGYILIASISLYVTDYVSFMLHGACRVQLHLPVTTDEELKTLEEQIQNKSEYDALV